MKKCLIVFLSLISTSIYSQELYDKIDKKSLKELTLNSQLETYYPELLLRYESFDTTLTTNDYRLIYYGFVLQDDYLGFYSDHRNVEMHQLFKGGYYEDMSDLCDTILKEIPVSLVAVFYKIQSINYLEQPDTVISAFQHRYDKLIEAILSSNDEPYINADYKVIYTEDQYEILFYLGITDYISHENVIMKYKGLRRHESHYKLKNDTIISFDNSEMYSKTVHKRVKKILKAK